VKSVEDTHPRSRKRVGEGDAPDTLEKGFIEQNNPETYPYNTPILAKGALILYIPKKGRGVPTGNPGNDAKPEKEP
jgi:hypothetical protein